MATQTVFKRYEFKYMLTPEQKERVLAAMAPYMRPDSYGRTTIRNIYYDTDTCLLIRRSMEKPTYKEKLRMRSYGKASPDDPVFVELKKKYKRVVYKRRIALLEKEAAAWLAGEAPCRSHAQIAEEIDYFLHYYKTLRPNVFLSYEREAFYAGDGSELRITFDDTILGRLEELSLESEAYGTPLLPPGKLLMEIKCSGSMPLWLAHTLSEEHIFKTTFSKYAVAYQKLIFSQQHGANQEENKEEDDGYSISRAV